MQLPPVSRLAVALSATLLSLACDGAIQVLEPEDGATLTHSVFEAVVELGEDVDPASLELRLNGVAVPLVPLPDQPGSFMAEIGPGGALAAQNSLVASAQQGGNQVQDVVNFDYTPPPALARRISDPDDLIQGPLGQGRVGDFLLENDVARFIVQDAPKREIYGVGQFGGNLIDLERLDAPERDNFIEMQPILNIETVINAQTVEVLNDGENGAPAVVESCGPDDTLDATNPSVQAAEFGFPLPPSLDEENFPITGCTQYVLRPGAGHLEVTTTIFNTSGSEVKLFVGDALNVAGEVDPWVVGPGGLGDLMLGVANSVDFVGFGDAVGIDYSRTSIPLVGAAVEDSVTVVISGITFVIQSNDVTGVLLNQTSFTVPPAGSNSFTRMVGVGDGDGAGALVVERDARGQPMGSLRGCVTVGGEPAAEARVAVLTPAEDALVSHFVTDAEGCYEGPVPPGDWVAAGWRRGTPFEGGGATPLFHPVSIQAAEFANLDLAFPATGRLRARVSGEDGEGLPARVTLVGLDPSPQPDLLAFFDRTGMFTDFVNDEEPYGVVRSEYANADGVAEFDVEPGTYQVALSRGSEYSLHTQTASVAAGTLTEIEGVLARVIDSAGFVSSDFHVHAIRSLDTRVSNPRRVAQFAGEGLENLVITDHGAHTDLGPVIEKLGVGAWLHSTIGEEITTSDIGHYNAYPLLFDPSEPSGGATDWSRAAPPGEDFVALGSFSLSPQEILVETTTQDTATSDTLMQINHIDSHFGPLKIDTSLVPPRSFLSDAEKVQRRLDPAAGEVYAPFPALELWNGSTRGDQQQFLNDRIGIWMNHLNQGLVTTAIADTDTHTFRNLRTAGARSWTPSSDDRPAGIRDAEVAEGVRSGRAIGGQGLFVQGTLRDADAPERRADLTLEGATQVSAPAGNLDLEIHVQSPVWAPYDEIEIYANAATTATGSNGGVPVAFTATPARALQLGSGDFAVQTVIVDPGVPGAARLETHVSVPFRGLSQDTWFVVLVRGNDGVSPPMFPVFANDLDRSTNASLADLTDGNLGEDGVLALGFTNALYADVDGVPGFQAPLAPPAP